MEIKLLLKLFAALIAPDILYGTNACVPAGKFTFDNWDKTEIEKN